MFEFQSDFNEKKFKNAKSINPILYGEDNDSSLYILVDHPLRNSLLLNLEKFIKSILSTSSFKIISALPFEPQEKDLKKSIFDLYATNGTKLADTIPPFSRIVTIGRGLYDILYGDDLSIEGFYDTILWNTSFFDPRTQSYVFPCPNQFFWIDKDTFERFFTIKQLLKARDFKAEKQRIAKPNLVYLDSKESCSCLLTKYLDYNEELAWDTETKGLNPWDPNGRLICLTLCFRSDPFTSYFLPYNLIDTDLLTKFFSNKKLVGNNSKYDIKWLVVKGNVKRSSLHLFWDNMKSSQCINELQFNSLKSDAWLYTPYGGYDFALEEYKAKFPACKEDYSLIPTKILFPYAAMDACVSMLCYLAHQKEIDRMDQALPTGTSWSIRRSLQEVSFPAIDTFTDIELNGMSYNWDKLKCLSNELADVIEKRREELYKLLDMPADISIDSGDQLGTFLEKKGWENPGRSKKGIYLTNDASMLYWKRKGHKEVVKLQEYIEYKTAMKTFVGVEKDDKGSPTGYYQYRDIDNKIHGTFLVMMADSGRNKSRNPNLQNVIKSSTVFLGSVPFTLDEINTLKSQPKKITVDRGGDYIVIESTDLLDTDKNPIPLHVRVRECFTVPSEDYVLSENDGKGLQLRIATVYSQDPVMKDIFLNRGGDMHSITAQSVFARDVTVDYFIEHKNEKPYKGYRKKAKSVNFGLLFNETSRAFASSTLSKEWTLTEAKEYVANNNLQDKQAKYYTTLIRDIPSEVIDVDCYKEDQLEFSFYWASADDIKIKFFETYKGLARWQEQMYAFARKNGYVQSLWGPIRRTPYLIYQGKDDDKGRIKNYENISVNSPVQNFEAEYVMYNMARSNKELKQTGKESYQIGNIHDSFLSYLKKDEIKDCKTIFEKYFHEPLPVMKGVPFEVEFAYTDCAKGEVWGITEHEF